MKNNSSKTKRAKIIIYKAKNQDIELKIRLDRDTIWLTQKEMAKLFDVDIRTINEHLQNIFKSSELEENSVIRKFRIVQKEGNRKVVRYLKYYNLDAIISVGYRVSSQKATHFRIWATKILKNHIIKGFTFNKKRLQEKSLVEFEQTVKLIRSTIDTRQLTDQETKGLLAVITEYANSWLLLEGYDYDRLPYHRGPQSIYTLTYDECQKAIDSLMENLFPDNEAVFSIFGHEVDFGLEAIIGNLNQSFDGKALYPGVKEKAAHLLYFVIKDHPFLEGNKRIGSFLFLLFLAKNHYLYCKDGTKKIDDYTLVALALLIAESKPEQKDTLIRLVMNFLQE